MTSDTRWEWSAPEIRRMGYQVVDLIADHLSRLPDTPVFQPFPTELAERYLHSAVPEEGASWETILKTFATEIAPFPFGNGHPRFYGWVNSPPVVVSVFSEALAAAMNPSCAGGNHAAIYLEREVINWFRQMLGFPTNSAGGGMYGLSDDEVTAIREGPICRFAPEEVAPLRIADAMAGTPSNVRGELYAELRRYFSQEQLIELAASAAFENFRARYNRVFDVGSDGLYRKGLKFKER